MEPQPSINVSAEWTTAMRDREIATVWSGRPGAPDRFGDSLTYSILADLAEEKGYNGVAAFWRRVAQNPPRE
jgi:hypothetical protein